ILALLAETELEVHRQMEKYELASVAGPVARFIDNVTNWYIRLNRSRYWEAKGADFSADKLSAYATLFEVLDRLAILLAPFLPFFSEYFHAALRHGVHPEDLRKNLPSVHEELFRETKPVSREDHLLVEEMAVAQRAILLGRSLRAEAKIGLRQPLQKISLAGLSDEDRKRLLALRDLVLSELNLKEIELLPDGSGLVVESAKPNLKRLGARVGKKIPQITGALKAWTGKEIAAFEKSGSAEVAGERLERGDVLIERHALEGKVAGALEGLVAELHAALTPELRREGLVRELVNRVQQRRKDRKLSLADRIRVRWHATGACRDILSAEGSAPSLLSEETLAVSWEECASPLDGAKEEFPEHDGAAVSFEVERV
ncbi:MAG: class I tRNA ligase family protein, partial [Bdellovibrionales bacterium]|nr:class I tRNA ligase family protein [Bdellovibrionales bacterium]